MNGDDKKILFSREELKQRLQQLEAEIQAREEYVNIPMSRTRKNWRICLLATLVLVIGLTCTYLLRDQKNKMLFSRYYEPYPNVVAYTEQGSSIATPLEANALELYETGHYAEALQQFERFPSSQQNQPDILFYAGISSIEINQLDKAEMYLTEAAQQHDSTFVAQAHWYLALIHLKKSERKQARKQLTSLAQYTPIYKEKASQLLREL